MMSLCKPLVEDDQKKTWLHTARAAEILCLGVVDLVFDWRKNFRDLLQKSPVRLVIFQNQGPEIPGHFEFVDGA